MAIVTKGYGKEEVVGGACRGLEMGYRIIGIAHCIGLAGEAEVIASIFEQWFTVKIVCCKVLAR